MNETQCTRADFLEVVFGMLERKELTYAMISRRLTLAVQHELLRPREEIRETFVWACLDLLYIVETTEAFVGEKAHGKLRLEATMALRRKRRMAGILTPKP